jgi:hypothetical protein
MIVYIVLVEDIDRQLWIDSVYFDKERAEARAKELYPKYWDAQAWEWTVEGENPYGRPQYRLEESYR